MTQTEAAAFAVAEETVRKMTLLAEQPWWTGWIAYLDHVRSFPEERRAFRWPWLRRASGILVDFEAGRRRRRTA